MQTGTAETAESEAELVARAAAGDGDAFALIMRRYNQRLFRSARSIIRNDAEAEDAVQEAWLRAWRAMAGFRAESRLSTWLVRITVNEALGRLRRKQAQIIPLETAMISSDPETRAALTELPEQGPEAALMHQQTRRLVEARIDRLPDSFRTVFVLRAVEEMSVADVAEALEIPESTVRSRFFRARGLLREALAQEVETALGGAFGFAGLRCDRITATVLTRGRAEGLARG
ncbi:RNA polymerase sigma factor [Paracoccus sp. (in: a-proteobacteria)]|uniref:RNA polymerase sigma factor n=1 Tax=Paracoccus sp. TaxID=267 RepID=UPI00322036F5